MAQKGQQFKKYTNEERIKIVQEYLNNEATPTILSKKYNISIKTIWNWITKYRSKGYNLLDNRPKFSGKRKEENIDYKERYEILKKYQAFLKAQRERK
jgi:transposase-like protein